MRKRTSEDNKKLVEKMPFLKPSNGFDDESVEAYDYSYTEIDTAEIPQGWKDLFLDYCVEIAPILEKANNLENFRFLQVKEKYGSLCIYKYGVENEIADEIDEIENKYVKKSKVTCCICGQPGKMTYSSWICPFCKNCWESNIHNRISYEEATKE